MLQIKESVASFMNGSRMPVSASGTTSMSLAWIGIHPRIDEPSKPRPSSNTSSVSSASGMVKCCQRPRKSMNLRSTITAFLSRAYPMTSFPLGIRVISSWSERVFAALAGADADRVLDGDDEDLSVSDVARLRGREDGLHHPPDQIVRDHHLDLDLRHQVHLVFGAAVQLGVALLPSHSLHLADGQAGDAQLVERVLDRVEFERLHDRLDQFHG